MPKKRRLTPDYIRNFTFGVEDSLASTVGLLSGVASANVAPRTIVVTGFVLIFTEALSMAIGSFLSQQSVDEYASHKETSFRASLPAAVIMFVSYLLAGLIPIAPYMVLRMPVSLYTSILFAVLGLGALGAVNAYLSKTPVIHHITRMMILGGSVTVAGVIIGSLFT